MVGQGYYAATSDAPAEFVLKRVPGKDGSYDLQKQFRDVHFDGQTGVTDAYAPVGSDRLLRTAGPRSA